MSIMMAPEQPLLQENPYFTSEATAGAAVSIKLGQELKKQGKVAEIDYLQFSEIVNDSIAEEYQPATTLVVGGPKGGTIGHIKGTYRCSDVHKKDAPTHHSLHLGSAKKDIRQGYIKNGAATVRHEAEHAADFDRLGPKKAKLRHRLYNIAGSVPFSGVAGGYYGYQFDEASTGNYAHQTREALQILNGSSYILSLVLAANIAYILNPFEVRARRAGRQYKRAVGKSAVNDLVVFHDA